MAAAETLQLYCVLRDGAEPERPVTDLDGRPVWTVRSHDLTALVSPAPARSYRCLKRDELVRHLAAHEAVIEQVLQRHTVVPVKFGTTALGEGEVHRILERGRTALKNALKAMDGKIELELVALWRDLNRVFAEIADDEEIRRRKASIAGLPPEATLEVRVQIGQLVKGRLEATRARVASEIVESMTPFASDVCAHARPGDRMILNTAFLVERAREGEFAAALNRLNDQYADTIDFRCVGPLPPYSFATVEVRRFDFAEINRARHLLGLGEQATLQEVKAAYQRLARRGHPDKVGERAGAGFEAVPRAYQLLTDYCRQNGGVFREPAVSETVGVSLLQWPREVSGA